MTTQKSEIELQLQRVLRRFSRQKCNLIPVLQAVQAKLGYLPRAALATIAAYLNVSEVEVYGVVTFYNQFRLSPPGKHPVRVCLGTACHMKGGYITLDAWQRRLGIGKGQTTPDGEFDLDTVACVGCCVMAPVTIIDSKPQAKVDPTRVDGILLGFRLAKEGKEKP